MGTIRQANAHRQAWGMLPGTYIGRPSRESQPELQPFGLRGRQGRRGQLDLMMLHPRVGSAVRSMRVEMQRQATAWEPADETDPRQVQFAERLQAMCDGDQIVTDATDMHSSWADVLAWAVDEWAYGFALGNWSLQGSKVEIYPVMPSTVDQWIRGTGPAQDEWVAVRQFTEIRSAIIPREALIHLRTQGAPGEWEGQSVLRPCLFAFESWYALAKAMLATAQMGSGVVKAKGPVSGVDSDDWAALTEQLVEFEQARRRIFQYEDGYDVDVSFPASGALGGMVEGLQYWDAQLDQALNRSMESLGFASHGSRALGEEMGEQADEQRAAAMEVILRPLGRAIARIVAAIVGYDGPLPRLAPVIERKRAVSGRVDVLARAVQGGLIRWTPEREADLAQELDLVEAEEVEPEPERLSACGCGACSTVKLAAPVLDRDGMPLEIRRPLIGVELMVSWGANEVIRLSADDDLATMIAEAAAQHRRDLWDVLPAEPGVPPEAADVVLSEAIERYVAVGSAYAIRIAGEVAVQSAAERHRQVQPDGSRAYVMPDADRIDRNIGARIEALVYQGARTIAQRVAGEVLAYWSEGGDRAVFATRQTKLHTELLPVGHLIEAEGRVEEAFSRAPAEGIVPVEAIRTPVRDGNACQWCLDHGIGGPEQQIYDLTTASGVRAYLLQSLPDPMCEGAPRCRCGWVVRYERLPEEEIERIRDEIGPILSAA